MASQEYKILIDVISETAIRNAKKVEDVIDGIGETAKKVSRKRVSDEEKAARDIESIQRKNLKAEQDKSVFVTREAEKQYQAKVKQYQRGLDEFLRVLNKEEAAVRNTAKKTQTAFGSAFSGGFLGSLAGTVTAYFANAFSQLPSMLTAQLEKATSAAEAKFNAILGLQSTLAQKGFQFTGIEKTLSQLDAVKAGFLTLSDAAVSYKNLLQFGFSETQATKLLQAITNQAVYGKGAMMSYKDAVVSATEGIKKLEGELADNIGLRNFSTIAKQAGIEVKGLDEIQGNAALTSKFYNQLMKDMAGSQNDLNLATTTYTGALTEQEAATLSLYSAIGDLFVQNDSYIASNKVITEQIRELTGEVDDQGDAVKKTGDTWVDTYSKIRAATIPFVSAIGSLFAQLYTNSVGMASSLLGVMSITAEGIFSVVIHAATGVYNAVADLVNKALGLIDSIPVGTEHLLGTTGGIVTGLRGRQMSRVEVPNIVGSVSSKFFSGAAEAFKDAGYYTQQFTKNIKEMGVAMESVEIRARAVAQERQQRELNLAVKQALAEKKLKDIREGKGGGQSGGAGGGSGGKAPTGNNFDREFRSFADEMDFIVSRTFGKNLQGRKGGSLHPAWLAGDLSIKGKTINEIVDALAKGIEKGWRALDERFVGALPGVKSTAPNAHFEVNPRKPSMFIENRPDLYGGQDVLNYLKELDRRRLNKGVVSADEVAALAKKSKEQIEKQEEVNVALQMLNNAQAVYGKEAIKIPETTEEIIAAYKELRSWARERIAGVDKSTRERIVPWQMMPGTEWFLDQQGDPNVQRTRDDRGRIRDFNQLNESLKDQLFLLGQNNRELSVYEQTLRDIERNYQHLDEAQQRDLLNTASQIDELKKLHEEYGKVKNSIREALGYLSEGDFKGFAKNILQQSKDAMLDRMSGWLATSVLGFDPEATKNPVVDRLNDSNKLLAQIAANTGGLPLGLSSSAATSGIRSRLSGIFSTHTGGFAGGGGVADILGGGGYGGGAKTGDIVTLPNGEQAIQINADGGGGGLGLFDNFKSLFGARKNLLNNKMSKAAGIAGGIGSIAAMVGQFLPGRLGRTVSYAGQGASLGANFGFLGSLVGAGIGAAIGLFSGGDKSIGRLKDAAKSEYSLDVRDKSILETVKAIGEQHFGQGQVAKRARETVRLEDAKDILRDYALQTGQSGAGLGTSRRDLMDENWSGNRHVFGGFREFGGSVFANRAYVVGEKRPELFVPQTNGNIIPRVPSASFFNQDRIMAMVLSQLQETMQRFEERLQTFSPGQVFAMGAGEAPDAAASAVLYSSSRNPKFSENFNINSGNQVW